MSALLLLIAAQLSIPPLSGPVVDQAGLLSANEREQIAAGLRDYQQRSGNQLQVLIVPSLPEDVPIEEYSIRVAEDWKLGSAEKDNGVLLLLAVQDRKWRIEVGGGLEGELTDIAASRLGREILVPAFQRGDYARGLAGTLQGIATALGGTLSFEGLPPPQAYERRAPTLGGLLPLILFALFMLTIGRRRRGGFLTGMILGGMMGGGRGGGGGGWGGGGGGFSGGGAGGDW